MLEILIIIVIVIAIKKKDGEDLLPCSSARTGSVPVPG